MSRKSQSLQDQLLLVSAFLIGRPLGLQNKCVSRKLGPCSSAGKPGVRGVGKGCPVAHRNGSVLVSFGWVWPADDITGLSLTVLVTVFLIYLDRGQYWEGGAEVSK